MQLDKLTVKAQQAIAQAQQNAASAGHVNITPLHLLDAMIQQEGGITVPLLENATNLPA